MRHVPTSALIFRFCAREPGQVKGVVSHAVSMIRHALAVKINGRPAFRSVMVVVAKDYDCGRTANVLRRSIQEGNLRATVLEATGHHSSTVLNIAFGRLEREEIDVAYMVAPRAIKYLEESTMVRFMQQFRYGAKVVGLSVDEATDIVDQGLIQNTFAAWHVTSLLEVGGFAEDEGAEEIAPIVRLTFAYPACIAVVKPLNDGEQRISRASGNLGKDSETISSRRDHVLETFELEPTYLSSHLLVVRPKIRFSLL